MWIKANPNPCGKESPDCVIRAVSIALNLSWYQVFDELCSLARLDCSMPSDNNVWGHYLYSKGFEPFLLPRNCPRCVTVQTFTEMFPVGTFIVGTGDHAIAVIDGNHYDSWDSSGEIISFFWRIY